jgi:hypothetical protein
MSDDGHPTATAGDHTLISNGIVAVTIVRLIEFTLVDLANRGNDQMAIKIFETANRPTSWMPQQTDR